MSNVSKKELIERIEDVLSYILSKKYDCKVRIHMKKDEITNGDNNTSRDIGKE